MKFPLPKSDRIKSKLHPNGVGCAGQVQMWVHAGVTVDLHEYLEGPHYSPPGPHPITKEDLPRTFGHEFAGAFHPQLF